MRIMFVASQLRMGGVETLTTRMARHLKEQGHDVFVVLLTKRADQGLLSDLKQSATVLYPRMNIYVSPLFGILRNPPKDIDYIQCFNTETLFAGMAIRQDHYPGVPVVTGVYHPREYCVPFGHRRFEQTTAEWLFRSLPSSNIFFMNAECATAHRPCTHFAPSDEVIIPLPVDTARYESGNRAPVRNRIVSVGRLTGFKTYTFHTVDTIARLRALGIDLEYHVYGDGEDREKLRQHIRCRNLEDRVYLHGTVPYDQLPHILNQAYAFIGMGTSLIEAAACGVPALIAIESNPRATTYGLFSESTGYDVGEQIDGKPEYDLDDCLADILACDADRYTALCLDAKHKASEFSTDTQMALYLDRLHASKDVDIVITAKMRLLSFVHKWLAAVSRRIHGWDPFYHRHNGPPKST